jgi:hypothetical protein
MSGPLTDARTWVADELAGIGVPVHASPPSQLTPPCLVVLADDPWLTPHTWGTRAARFRVAVIAAAGPITAAGLDRLEELTWAVLGVFPTAGEVGEPATLEVAGLDVITATVPLTITITDD